MEYEICEKRCEQTVKVFVKGKVSNRENSVCGLFEGT
jgi:hypothetical protein